MPIEELQSLALMLGRSLWVRWFAFLNYPFDPQLMGLSLIETVNGKMESFKGGDRLQQDLSRRGFAWNDDLRMWTIERKERG